MALSTCFSDRGADPKAQDNRYGNALTASASRGYELVVGTLLEHGVNIHCGRRRGTPLYAAAFGGLESIAKMRVAAANNARSP